MKIALHAVSRHCQFRLIQILPILSLFRSEAGHMVWHPGSLSSVRMLAAIDADTCGAEMRLLKKRKSKGHGRTADGCAKRLNLTTLIYRHQSANLQHGDRSMCWTAWTLRFPP